jgi:hypothetical protein
MATTYSPPPNEGDVMSLEGHVENGVVVFDQPVSLPDGTPVRVEVIPAARSDGQRTPERTGHFLNHYQNVIGAVTDLPPDAALNHDHYLYGLPKK